MSKSDTFNIYKVTPEQGATVYFINKNEAAAYQRAISCALGFRGQFEYQDKFDEETGILRVVVDESVPGIQVIKGVTNVLDKDQVDPENSESEAIITLRDEIEKLKGELSTAKWKADEARKKAEQQELNACRLAGVLEANGLTTDGAAENGQVAGGDDD